MCPCHAGGSRYESGSSHAGRGDASGGEADADDEDDHLQRQMEEKDVDGYADNTNFDDSNEEVNSEEALIPNSWNMDYSSAKVMNDGHDSAWEYHQNNVSAGALYPDKQHLQEEIMAWAMSTQRVFKTIVSNKKYLTVEHGAWLPEKVGHGVDCE
jgi:hypothetical protein